MSALATAGLLAATTPAVASPGGPTWRPCGPQGVVCATIKVPVAGEKKALTLNLARLPATQARRGTVLYAPGGPGKDGIQQLKDAAGTLAGLRAHFDVVAFDTRHLRAMKDLPEACSTTSPLLAEPRTRAQFERQAERRRAAFERCADGDRGGLFAHADSAAVARDMDAVRAALGERRINITGESYGTIIAAAYARQFPHRVRAMHLDSAADHTTTSLSAAVATDPGEKMLGRFAAWCRSAASCALRGQDVRKVWRDLVRRADRDPVPVSSPQHGSGRLTGMHLQLIGSSLIRDTRSGLWQVFAQAVEQARRGDFSVFGRQVLGISSAYTQPRNLAGWCGDGFGFASYRAYAKARRTLDERLPSFGRAGLWVGLACSGWPYRPANPPRPLPAAELPPLLGSGTWTDYAATAALVRRVPGSVAVSYDGPGHVLYISGTSRCVAGHVERYFTRTRLPAAGTVCRPGT